jgi:alkylresorcinol/alkylpyrone synthase
MRPRLLSIATAAPAIVLDRDTVAATALELFGAEAERLASIFANSGVDSRRSCVPLEWYARPHFWAERSRLFVEHGLALASRAAAVCLGRAGMPIEAVDAVVAVTTSGVCTPSLDALVIDRLGLRPDATRLPVFGLGCAGGVLGLARAAALAKAAPGSRVLMVVVELCGLTFRPNDPSKSNIVATALFGDGAAAALVSTKGDGPALSAWGEHTWPDSLDVMGWRVEDDGLGVLFSPGIPALIRGRYRAALDAWLARAGMPFESFKGFLCHPGGAKVIAALEEALALAPGTLETERAVLREWGNMSAASLLFVIERAWRSMTGRHLATALGPGFTAGFLVLEA